MNAEDLRAQQLGGLDAAFLSCETPTMHMHVCGLLILERPPDGDVDLYESIHSMLEERLPRIPAMRHRLTLVPLNMGRPFWVDDPDLHIDRHLQHVRLTSADNSSLADVVGAFASTQLRRDRPLWELLVVEGLPKNRVALVIKMHHSTIDGVTGANLISDLFDLNPAPPPRSEVATTPIAGAPNPILLLGEVLLERLTAPFEIVKLLPTTAWNFGSAVWRLAVGPGKPAGPTMPFTAPRTSFNATVTSDRSVAFIDVALPEVKAIKNAFGVTINDVLTAVVGGALRSYLADRGELPDRPLIAAEPISVHGRAPEAHGTTQVSVMFTTLATDAEDPVERLRTISASNRRAKAFNSMVGTDSLLQWAEHFWLNGFTLGARLYSRLHAADHHAVIHNLILSNVPGPTIPLYLAGGRLVGLYPLGPVMDGAGLNITVLSQEDRVGFGIMACPDLVPDVWKIAEAIPEALKRMGSCVSGGA